MSCFSVRRTRCEMVQPVSCSPRNLHEHPCLHGSLALMGLGLLPTLPPGPAPQTAAFKPEKKCSLGWCGRLPGCAQRLKIIQVDICCGWQVTYSARNKSYLPSCCFHSEPPRKQTTASPSRKVGYYLLCSERFRGNSNTKTNPLWPQEVLLGLYTALLSGRD